MSVAAGILGARPNVGQEKKGLRALSPSKMTSKPGPFGDAAACATPKAPGRGAASAAADSGAGVASTADAAAAGAGASGAMDGAERLAAGARLTVGASEGASVGDNNAGAKLVGMSATGATPVTTTPPAGRGAGVDARGEPPANAGPDKTNTLSSQTAIPHYKGMPAPSPESLDLLELSLYILIYL